MEDKVVVTHGGALRAKYGPKGLTAIRAALAKLTKADQRRGIGTRIVYLDDAAAMKKLKAVPVATATSPRAFKLAIDGVYAALRPDYLMILGAPDVVPHQDLHNTADDDDARADGDLPYACDAAYSRNPADFVGATRVVGRLPDLTSADEPSHLLALLKTACEWQRRDAGEYASHLGLTAHVWRASTALSLDEIFGSHDGLLIAPPKGPEHPRALLQGRLHFINCHGATAAPEFYGEKSRKYPVAFSTQAIAGAIREGTVVAAECCYGGQLYDAATLAIDMPICQSYLAQGAYGFLGSTTIAYGPSDGNGAADLLTQFFLINVLAGASIGRAALMARQQYVQRVAQMDPIDLKTLAQFCVYGDPSVHPVKEATTANVPKGTMKAMAQRLFRGERRQKLQLTGEFLQRTKPTAAKPTSARVSAPTRRSLAKIAEAAGLPAEEHFTTFDVTGTPRSTGPSTKRTQSLKSAMPTSLPTHYHMAIGRPRDAKSPLATLCVLAKEADGRILDYRVYQRR